MKVNSQSTTTYHSFEEVAAAFNLKPVQKVTSDKEKLKSQQEKFISKHKCRACGEPLVLVNGTNVMTCKNPKCRGIKIEREIGGEKVVSYVVSSDLLSNVGADIANNIFSEV